MWQQWVNAILGLVVIAVAFMGLAPATMMWTLIVVGAVVAILGFWGAAVSSSNSTSSNRRSAVYS